MSCTPTRRPCSPAPAQKGKRARAGGLWAAGTRCVHACRYGHGRRLERHRCCCLCMPADRHAWQQGRVMPASLTCFMTSACFARKVLLALTHRRSSSACGWGGLGGNLRGRGGGHSEALAALGASSTCAPAVHPSARRCWAPCPAAFSGETLPGPSLQYAAMPEPSPLPRPAPGPALPAGRARVPRAPRSWPP